MSGSLPAVHLAGLGGRHGDRRPCRCASRERIIQIYYSTQTCERLMLILTAAAADEACSRGKGGVPSMPSWCSYPEGLARSTAAALRADGTCGGDQGEVPSAPKATGPSWVRGQLPQGEAWSLSGDPSPWSRAAAPSLPSHTRTMRLAADAHHGRWGWPLPEDPPSTHSPHNSSLWAREHSRIPWLARTNPASDAWAPYSTAVGSCSWEQSRAPPGHLS